MKLGKAKIDAGFPPAGVFSPHEHNKNEIIKGYLWNVPDDYNFKYKNAIFSTVKDEKKGNEVK